jgi:type IV pilus assembly protein PilY1
MFTSFIPTSDPCGMGGNSYVYAVYYLTGTAYPTPTIGTGAANLVLSRSATSSVGQASSITIHSGREAGATAYIQMSTGQTITVSATPPTTIKSGIISWREL